MANLRDQVLDIGSGDNPHPRADVCLDSSLSDEHRWGALSRKCPLVLGDLEALPFRDKEFDVALCFHVLEHVRNPLKAALEIQRVAVRGILEMPTLYGDLLFQPYLGHRWVFALDGDGLIYAPHPIDLVRFNTMDTTLFLLRHSSLFRAAFLADTNAFRVRLHWSGVIPIRQVPLDEVVHASTFAVQSGHSAAISETVRRFGGYISDIGAAALRRAVREVVN